MATKRVTAEWAFERLERLDDHDLVGAVLNASDLCESNAESVGCLESANAARCLRGAVAAVLDRFAPEAFEAALSIRGMGDDSELETSLTCVECGRESAAGDVGWRSYLTDDNELATYCRDCAREEFGDA